LREIETYHVRASQIGIVMTAYAPTASTTALRRAAIRATLAPSVHNTQPWRLVIKGDELNIFADRSRQLQVLDPTTRQLLISCGCALFNARVSLRAYASRPARAVLRQLGRRPYPLGRDRPTLIAGCLIRRA
jgi:hypothetical protein